MRAGLNGIIADKLYLRKSLHSPPPPALGKTTHHNFQIRAQQSLRVRHLHQDFTFGGKRQEKVEKVLQPFPRVPKEAEQQRAAQADDTRL